MPDVGVVLYLTAILSIAIELLVVHWVGHIPTPQIALVDNTGGIILLTAIALISSWENSGIVIRSQDFKMQLLRVGLGTARFWALIYAFSHLPLLDATALSYLQSCFLILFSWTLLHEAVGLDRWLRVAIGFMGAMLVVRPTFSNLSFDYAIGLLAPALSALTTVSTKWTYRKDAVNTTYFWIVILNFAISASMTLLLSDSSIESIRVLYLPLWALVIIMICGPMGTYLLLWSAKKADLSKLAPFGFMRLVINVFFGILIFSEKPVLLSAIGILLILVSCFSPVAMFGRYATAKRQG